MTSPDDISSMPTDMESCHPHHCDNSNSPSLGSSKKTASPRRPPSLHLPKSNTITFPSPPSSSSLASPPSFDSFDFGAFQLFGYQHETREPLQTMEPITVPPSSTESSPQGSISEMEPVTPVTISRPGPGASDSGIFLPLSPSILTKPSYDPILPSIESETPSVDLEKNCEEPLPPKRHRRFVRHARHTFFNVYRRLFTTVFIFNIIGLAILLARNHHWTTSPPLSGFATAASANILVALLIRQDYIVNLVFRLTWFVPHSAPLRLRRILAKVYEYGGVHSGAAVSSVLWFTLLTAFLTNSYVKGAVEPDPAAIITFSYLLLALLLALCITAYPRFRFKSHNTFENVHRFAGWFSLALFWAEIIFFARTQLTSTSAPLGILLIRLPAFWFLLVASLHTIAPWLRLHRVAVTPEKLSDHAIRLHFKEKVPLFVGLRISDSPLREWHSFACIPSRDGGKSGGSVLISDAGDWTRKTIQNPKPYYYLKGVPVTGVLCMAQIFKRVVIVTTGSGIGPCLGVMQDIPQTKCRVIWSTPTPELVYGKNICEAVRDVDKEAVVWDTRERGRPNLVEIAWRVFTETNAEAVFVISNPKLTRKVVYGMEARGVPAFGPIWDS